MYGTAKSMQMAKLSYENRSHVSTQDSYNENWGPRFGQPEGRLKPEAVQHPPVETMFRPIIIGQNYMSRKSGTILSHTSV